MIKRCAEFYTNLYSTKLPQGQTSMQIHNTRSTPPPPILPTEMSAAIKRLKRNKAPGNDNITADVLKDGGEPIVQMFTNMFIRCLREGKLPNSWKDASVIIIHKKGDTGDIKILQTDKLAINHIQSILSGDPALDVAYGGPTSTERAGWLQVRIFYYRSHSSDQSITGKGERIQDPSLLRLPRLGKSIRLHRIQTLSLSH